MNEIIKELEINNDLLEATQNKVNQLKVKLTEELKNAEEKNIRTDKALYSLKTITNDIFNENKLKEENEAIYNSYLKTKVSFDVTTFKKKEKDLVEKYTEKGTETYSLRIEANKVEDEKEIKEVEEIEL